MNLSAATNGRHAARNTEVGPERVEAWIGIEDSLPRKVSVTLEVPNPEDLFRDRIFIVPVDPESPIVRRGKWPEVSVVTYTYSFSDFNAPVEITPPLP